MEILWPPTHMSTYTVTSLFTTEFEAMLRTYSTVCAKEEMWHFTSRLIQYNHFSV